MSRHLVGDPVKGSGTPGLFLGSAGSGGGRRVGFSATDCGRFRKSTFCPNWMLRTMVHHSMTKRDLSFSESIIFPMAK